MHPLYNLFNKPIKFSVCNMDRYNYYCILPNDIVQSILNFIDERIYLSLVSFQFYTVNREFVANCYHLHYYSID